MAELIWTLVGLILLLLEVSFLVMCAYVGYRYLVRDWKRHKNGEIRIFRRTFPFHTIYMMCEYIYALHFMAMWSWGWRDLYEVDKETYLKYKGKEAPQALFWGRDREIW